MLALYQAGKVAGIPSPSHQKEPGTAEAQQDDAQQEHTASRGEQAMMQSVVGQLVASEAGDTDGSRAEKREGQLLPNGGRKVRERCDCKQVLMPLKAHWALQSSSAHGSK